MPIKQEIKNDPIKYAEYLKQREEKKKEQSKKYRDENKEKIKIYNAQYHEKKIMKQSGATPKYEPF